MRKSLTLLIMLLALSAGLWAQAPQKFNYQAVARDNAGNILANTAVSFYIVIHDGSPAGADVFHETHNVSTNQFGLVNLVIGDGTLQAGTLGGID